MTVPNPRLLHDAVLTRLNTLTGVTVYDGEVGDPPTVANSGRVRPYVVLYTGVGRAGSGRRIIAQPWRLGWSLQVTCVGGYQPDATQCAASVRALLTDWSPPVTGADVGYLFEVLDEVLVRRDDDVSPPRYYSTPIWRLTAANAA